MGSKISTPSTPDIMPLPATQAGGMTPTITPMPTIPRKDPRTTPLAQNEFGFNKRFANQEAFDSAYQDYLNTYKDDYSQYGQGNRRALEPRKATPIGSTPLPVPEGVQIGYGPIRGGYFYGDGTPYNPPGSLGTLGGRRPISSSNFSGEKIIPTMEQYGAMVKLAPGVSLQEAYNNAFGPLAIQSPDSTAGIMSGLPQVPTPPGMPDNVFVGNATLPGPSPQLPLKPGISPLRPPNYDNLDEYQKGYLESDFYSPVGTADVRPYTYKGKEMSGSGTYVSGFQDYLNSIGQGDLFSSTPRPSFSPLSPPTIGSVQPLPNGTGIAPSTGMPQPINQPPMSPGELINPIKNTAPIQTPTEVPQPMNPVTGNTSPIGGSQQDFDAYMNSYVNDLINQRMKNVFGGIMSSFS